MYTQAKLLEGIMQGLPYPAHVKDIDITTEGDAVRFTWRGDRFRISSISGMVEESDGHLLSGSNLAILAEQCIKNALLKKIESAATVA